MTKKIIIGVAIVAGLGAVAFILLPIYPPIGGETDAQKIQQVEVLQDDYFAKYGRYLQVLPNAILPSDDVLNVDSDAILKKMEKLLDYRVDIAESSKGWSYEIIKLPPPPPPWENSTST